MSMCERPEQVRQVSNRLMGEKKSSLNVQTLLVCVCARAHARTQMAQQQQMAQLQQSRRPLTLL